MSERARRKQADAARQRIMEYNAIRKRGGTPDLADVRTMVFGDDPDVASRASALLLLSVAERREAFDAEVLQLIRAAQSANLQPRARIFLLWSIAWTRCLYMLQDFARTQRQPEPGLVAQTAALAEAGFRLDPNSYRTRKALAFVRCVQDRDREARDLLITAPIEQLKPTLRSDVLAIRALAELQMKDIAQARRLVNLARTFDQTTGLINVMERIVTAVEQESATDSGAEQPAT